MKKDETRESKKRGEREYLIPTLSIFLLLLLLRLLLFLLLLFRKSLPRLLYSIRTRDTASCGIFEKKSLGLQNLVWPEQPWEVVAT